jgi:DNA invertase Pin-like site-specific DNA recombinase
MHAVGYIRVSTTGQAVDGVSLEAQKEKIIAMVPVQRIRAGGHIRR